MLIELRRLSYLIMLAKRLSYSRAAMELGLSQSALTRAIQSLESDIGIRLFDRDQSGVRLTEQGGWVVAKAEILVTNATDFSNQLAFAAKGAEGRTRFGMTDMAAHLLLPASLPSRISGAPGFAHEILVRDVEPLYLMLAQAQIEFLVCSEITSTWSIPDVMPITISALGKLPIGLVVRRGHPLLDSDEAVGRFPVIVASVASITGRLVSGIRDSLGSSLQIIEDIGIIRHVVQGTDAIWLTCPLAVSEEIRNGVFQQLPMPAGIEAGTFELYAYSLARRSQSLAASQILEEYASIIARMSAESCSDLNQFN